MIKKYLGLLFLTVTFIWCYSQDKEVDNVNHVDKITENFIDKSANFITEGPVLKLSPTRAGLYSTVFPGLGQIYNKMYWKVPLVWGAIGTCVGIASWNHRQYKRYRSAFLDELSGRKHEFSGISGINAEVLGRTQDSAKRTRDYLIAVTAGFYILNILDAVVDAHLLPMKKDPDFAFSPTIVTDYIGTDLGNLGLSFKYRF